jgi:hypothetical protein
VALAASLSGVKEGRRLRAAAIPLYWHLLSLDAPTIAVLWAWSFAGATGEPASAAALAVLGAGTWLLYIADRLLDGRPGAESDDLRERHVFHARHRRVLMAGGGVVAAGLAGLIVFLPRAARREDTVLFALCAGYFLAIHLPRRRVRFPRELAVGILFACACAIPAWSASPASHAELRWLVPLLAALCWLNCHAIHVWERVETARQRSWVTPLALLLAAAAAAFLFATASRGAMRLAAAMLAAALLILALDRDQRRARRKSSSGAPLSLVTLRILADAALLTPLLLLIPWRL